MWVNGIFEASGLLETSVQDKKNINTKVFIKENDKWKKKNISMLTYSRIILNGKQS